MKPGRWLKAGAAGVVLAGLALLAWQLGPWGGRPVLGPTVTYLEHGRPMPAFQLAATRNGTFSDASLQGHWTFLTFGYTHCPDVCPTHLALLAQVLHRLPRQREQPQVVFISVDAPRDTLPLLSRYVPAFDPAFIGATGSDAALKPLTQELGVYYVRNQDEPGMDQGNYSVDHTSSIFLMAPDGSLRAVFQDPLDPAQMVQDTAAILAR